MLNTSVLMTATKVALPNIKLECARTSLDEEDAMS